MKTPPGLNKVDKNAPFWQELRDENAHTINVNGKDIKRCLWNLLVTRRDVNLYAKGIKPHRGWKIGDVKKYFGISGGKDKIRDTIEYIHNEFLDQPPRQAEHTEEEKKDS